jgi:hypothetical protein
LQKAKVLLAFLDLIKAKIKKTHGSVERVFLMVKFGPGFMGSLTYSLIKVWLH